MKTDIEIAHETKLQPIQEVAKRAGIAEEVLEPYGKYIAKIPYTCIDDKKVAESNLILVTAITPTKAGIGKTTVSIGLSLGLNKIGKKAVIALREPSLGPCFGMKGGAAGGGYAQVLPVLWKRVMDVNDRNLRNIVTGLGSRTDGITMESGFDITPASEIMAILCLAKDIEDLYRRIDNMLLGIKHDGTAFTMKELGVTGSIVALLMDALNPNLVQTTENTPAFVHGGPFANIAHGCNTVIATRTAMTYGEYVITEAGFGADLGAEKFFDIKCRMAGLQPKLTVVVATTQALKLHGGVNVNDIKEPNKEGLQKGFENLDKHVRNIQSFGQTVVVCFNRYAFDTDEEMQMIRQHCEELGVAFAENNAFAEGGKGAENLARVVVDQIENNPSKPLKYQYEEEDDVKMKVEKIATQIYGAMKVTYLPLAFKKLKMIETLGYSNLAVCIAKTQYSFSDDPKKLGVPKDFVFTIRDFVISAGAGMIVAIAGNIMRMPGLPESPQAERINVVNGEIVGLS